MKVLIFLSIGLVLFAILIVTVITLSKNAKLKKGNLEVIDFNFEGAAYNNIVMYKARQEKALNTILANFNKYNKDSLFANIDELMTRLVNGQNNGYISNQAFQKTAIDEILKRMRNMKKVDVSIINYESFYMSVAIIFESLEKDLYQLLMKVNVQNGLLYLDSYNATLWFKKD